MQVADLDERDGIFANFFGLVALRPGATVALNAVPRNCAIVSNRTSKRVCAKMAFFLSMALTLPEAGFDVLLTTGVDKEVNVTYEDLIDIRTETELAEIVREWRPADISNTLDTLRPITIRVQKVVACTTKERVDPGLLYDLARTCQFSAPVLTELASEMNMETEAGEFILALAAVHSRDQRFQIRASGNRRNGKATKAIHDAAREEKVRLLCIAFRDLRYCCANLGRYETDTTERATGGIGSLLAQWTGSVAALRSAGGQLTAEHERDISRLALTALAAARRAGWTGSAESLGIQPWTAKEAKSFARAFGHKRRTR